MLLRGCRTHPAIPLSQGSPGLSCLFPAGFILEAQTLFSWEVLPMLSCPSLGIQLPSLNPAGTCPGSSDHTTATKAQIQLQGIHSHTGIHFTPLKWNKLIFPPLFPYFPDSLLQQLFSLEDEESWSLSSQQTDQPKAN